MTTVTARLSRAPGSALCVGLLMAGSPRQAAPAGEPSPIVVPQALRVHVPMLELSGLVWAPTLDRFLTVVDDSIDTDENERHAPFLLALDRTGRLDAELVPIDGVEAVDDGEALTTDGVGTFFLITSHSPNRRGKVKKHRRQLLQMKLEGRRLRVTGALDLLQGDGGMPRQIEKLGLPAGTALDIEALTFHKGALYVGLKAPLLADGSALIFRLDRPLEAFAAGKLSANSLVHWAQVKLSVPGETGTAVSQGIADLLFASDGALYLCANAPKAGPKDGGGALWRLRTPQGGKMGDKMGGKMEATLVRRFAGLKPEGVAASPSGNALTLVFDRNRLDPMWTMWPLNPAAVPAR